MLSKSLKHHLHHHIEYGPIYLTKLHNIYILACLFSISGGVLRIFRQKHLPRWVVLTQSQQGLSWLWALHGYVRSNCLRTVCTDIWSSKWIPPCGKIRSKLRMPAAFNSRSLASGKPDLSFCDVGECTGTPVCWVSTRGLPRQEKSHPFLLHDRHRKSRFFAKGNYFCGCMGQRVIIRLAQCQVIKSQWWVSHATLSGWVLHLNLACTPTERKYLHRNFIFSHLPTCFSASCRLHSSGYH